MSRTLTPLLQLGLDLLGQALAELDAPLVEAVDVPHRALGEGEVLVVGDQRAQCGGGDFLGEDRGRGSVAEEGFVRDEVVGGAFGFDFVGGFADHEGFGLGEEVGGEHSGGQVSRSVGAGRGVGVGTYFWCLLFSTGLWLSAARMKSVGISFVPWCKSW